jgi:ElaB/YqjD/DUF883 family membrane-anchored ribosome-binding protein
MNETMSDPANQEAANKFESGKTHAKQAAEDLRAAAEQKAAELKAAAETKAQELKGRAGEAYEQMRSRARTWQEEGEAYVRENPLRGVVTALGAGFVLGLLFRRR